MYTGVHNLNNGDRVGIHEQELNACKGTIHLVRTHRRGVGGSSAMRTSMYCRHSDVIIRAYRVDGWV